MRDNVLKLTGDPVAFFSEVGLLNVKNKKNDLLIKLNNDDKIDICSIALEALKLDFSVLTLDNLIGKSLPHFTMEVDTFIEYMRVVNDLMQGNFAQFRQYDVLEELAKLQPEFAREILDKLLGNSDSKFIGHMSVLLEFFSLTTAEREFCELDKLLESEDDIIVQSAIHAYGEIIKKDQNQKQLILLLHTFQDFIKIERKELYGRITQVLCHNYTLGGESINLLEELITKNDVEVHYQISNFLFREFNDIYRERWFSSFLFSLSSVNCKYKGIINNLDYVLDNLLEVGKDEIVFEFIYTWIKNSDYITCNFDFVKEFNSVFARLLGQPNLLNMFISNTFFNNCDVFNKVAYNLISYVSSHNYHRVTIPEVLLLTKSYKEVLEVCIKIIGYVFDINILLNMLFSVLDFCLDNNILADEVIDLIHETVGKDYSFTTLKYINDNKNFKSGEKQLIKLAEKIQNVLDNDTAYHLNEIMQPMRYRRLINFEKGRVFSEQMRNNKSHFSFTDLFSQVKLKYGNGWFQEVNGNYEVTRGLQEFTSSYELPKGQLSYRVSDEIKRRQYRLIQNRSDL